MSKAHAAFLAVLLAVVLAVGVPVTIAFIDLLIPVIASSNKWQFSALLSAVAAPFFYAMLRRMK